MQLPNRFGNHHLYPKHSTPQKKTPNQEFEVICPEPHSKFKAALDHLRSPLNPTASGVLVLWHL